MLMPEKKQYARVLKYVEVLQDMRNEKDEMPNLKKDVFRKAGFLRPLIILYEKAESIPIL